MTPAGKEPNRKRRRRQPLELRQVRGVLSEAIVMIEHYIIRPAETGKEVDVAELCKLTHALSQAANTYRGIVETEEIAQRLDEMEAQLALMYEGSSSDVPG